MVTDAVASALVNFVVLVFIPFAVYGSYHKLRRGRGLGDILSRVGLRLGEPRYLAYAGAFALVAVILLILGQPNLEPILREGSAWRKFDGLGLTTTSISVALIYGIAQTGFTEEFFFRGIVTGSLSRRLPLVWANLAQALLFTAPHLSFLHLMPELWRDLVFIFAGSLFGGWIRISSGSMLGPWLIHAAVNLTMGLSVAIRTAL